MNAKKLESYLHASIPVSALMDIRVTKCGDGEIALSAPLAINHNHLGTAFGGSLAAVATLTGYCALWTALGDKNTHVVVRRSHIEYLHPVTGDISATCRLPEKGINESFLKQYQRYGKARTKLKVSVMDSGVECLRYTGEFVAIAGE
ncbi:YiiD C-terminal domain-containing protein [Luteolibacter sp. AS25]|uniref:YiiD C-terminal domain-containing protein n=1 Tax=Luteolibacter sp. AS25 TaxID=3135776 RepID=UPI00398B846E